MNIKILTIIFIIFDFLFASQNYYLYKKYNYKTDFICSIVYLFGIIILILIYIFIL